MAESNKKIPYGFRYFKTSATNINHTALYKAGEKTGKMKLGNLLRFITTGRKNKNDSREHEEVVVKAGEALGYKVKYLGSGVGCEKQGRHKNCCNIH